MQKEEREDILSRYFRSEAGLYQLIGGIGSGKTYWGTYIALKHLQLGEIVYTSWPINFDGFDERENFPVLLWGLLGLRKDFVRFNKSNWRYAPVSDEWAKIQGYEKYVDWVASRKDCVLIIDEAHTFVDSYEMSKMSLDKRIAILHTRHFNRTMYFISQRFSAIHVVVRENVNVFYKTDKLFSMFGFILFRLRQYDTKGNGDLDLDNPVGRSLIRIGSKRVYRAYDTNYLRKDKDSVELPQFDVFSLSWIERLRLMARFLGRAIKRVVVRRTH